MTPKRVLVVDDSALMRKIYEVLLQGLPVTFAVDGEDGLARLAAQPDIDLVLLDLNMPRLGGLGVLARLRESGALDRVAVIVVTTEGKESDAERAIAAGAAAFVRKPFKSHEVREVIASLQRSTPS